jgi:hypothetical protein
MLPLSSLLHQLHRHQLHRHQSHQRQWPQHQLLQLLKLLQLSLSSIQSLRHMPLSIKLLLDNQPSISLRFNK